MNFIIAGASGTGKHLLLEELNTNKKITGIKIHNNLKAELINATKSSKQKYSLSTTEINFEKELAIQQITLEKEGSDAYPNIFNGGIFDIIGHIYAKHKMLPIQVSRYAMMTNYSAVFFMPYKKDTSKDKGIYSESMNKQIHSIIKHLYLSMGILMIDIPIIPVKDQAKFINEEIKKIVMMKK